MEKDVLEKWKKTNNKDNELKTVLISSSYSLVPKGYHHSTTHIH